ncbi:probable serine/threonine-protein kinase DDB_G0282963 [Lucilia cuprina]|uniref:probable serine/threonine-protein kinase DDB_G0282963 n=1 Tax=Lucilia cuprina TaxID=7375 RepID=UPI001F057B46|nr:probable serine/threonine-protein kinase DDB_G0282963 [Lucilia cuprina]XP_046801904.1 probable serine/threonine-protein kinase DDB_G0282963 [Lucilia cuprina]
MMATSLFTDCSSMQGSTTSSSSDMMTLTTAASSWCAIPASTRIRLIRLLRPHSRRILVTPGAVPSYGFSVRGGKEFSTGFFVSSVDRNSEAEQKGLRIGDQILRINGFRIDDAIHKEFVQLVSHQERLTLKVRSVGMLPVKDKDNDGLTWNVVKTPSISSTNSECSYQSSERTERAHSRNQGERVINVVLNVAPRTKLGLGICKGPEWKPGIFVQFTKEKSVAREAGLRPGDQILTVNSIDFSDVLFSEAVAVMKSSNKLDMTVHTGAGCDLFPGESSGYNSSASSVTGDQSPCWADVKSKRLTAVREESSNGANWNQPLYANEQRRCRSKSITERSANSNLMAATNLPVRQNSSTAAATNCTAQTNVKKEINKTIIKLSENGATSINNTFVENATPSSSTGTIRKTLSPTQKENREEPAAMEGTLTKFNQSPKTPNILPPPPPMAMLNHTQHQQQHQPQNHSYNFDMNSNSAASTSSCSNAFNKCLPPHDDGDIKIGGVAATMQRYQYANLQLAKLNKAAATTTTSGDSSTYSNMNLNMESEKSSGGFNDGGSLSSAITEELKKRKARRQPPAFKEHAPHNEMKPLQYEMKRENNNNHQQQHHHHQPTSPTAATNINTNTLNGNDNHKTAAVNNNSNNINCNNNNNNSNNNTLNVVGDQHSALMNEFKQAHKRMFKNGFKECGNIGDSMKNRDRKEALLNTTILDDAGTCRSKGPVQTKQQQNDTMDSREPNKQETNSHIPKPPPLQMTNNNNTFKANNTTTTPATHSTKTFADSRLTNGVQNGNAYNGNDTYSRPNKSSSASTNGYNNNTATNNTQANRQTLRLGTVTIGEYRQPSNMRREPEKFDFLTAQKKGRDSGDTTPTNEALQSELQSTLSRANLRKSNGNSYTEHQRNCPLHQQQQQLQQRQSVDYGNNGFSVEEISKKLQKSSINDNHSGEMLTKTNNRPMNGASGTTGVGILKNGNRNGSSSSKSTEKSIKFG